MCPKMGGTPKSSMLIIGSSINHAMLGIHHLWKKKRTKLNHQTIGRVS